MTVIRLINGLNTSVRHKVAYLYSDSKWLLHYGEPMQMHMRRTKCDYSAVTGKFVTSILIMVSRAASIYGSSCTIKRAVKSSVISGRS